MTEQSPYADAVRIIKTVAEYFDVPIRHLIGPYRSQPVALYRQIAMYLCRDLTELSLPQVGMLFGRHHTTVLHAQRKIGDARTNGGRHLHPIKPADIDVIISVVERKP